MADDLINVSELEEYYGSSFDSRVLLLNINTPKEVLREKVVEFARFKSLSYIDFIDPVISEEDIVLSHQLVNHNHKNPDAFELFDVRDTYHDGYARFTSLSDIIDAICDNIDEYAERIKEKEMSTTR